MNNALGAAVNDEHKTEIAIIILLCEVVPNCIRDVPAPVFLLSFEIIVLVVIFRMVARGNGSDYMDCALQSKMFHSPVALVQTSDSTRL